jgi:ubiquitin-protein ligase
MDDQKIQQNNAIIDNFKYTSVKRRLKRELEKMGDMYQEIVVDKNDDDSVKVDIFEIGADSKIQKYGFIISSNYPFTPPKIFFQNKPYLEFLKTSYEPNFRKIFKRIVGQECFCCHSVNCSGNWSPGLTLDKIIGEVKWIKNKRRQIIIKLLADKIKLRYLIDDINLDEWLF